MEATNQLTFGFDTWPGGGKGYYIRVNGMEIAHSDVVILADGGTETLDVEVSWNPTNGATLSVNGTEIFTDVDVSGYTGSETHHFAFGARTGGATEDVLIDNIEILPTSTATATVTVSRSE